MYLPCLNRGLTTSRLTRPDTATMSTPDRGSTCGTWAKTLAYGAPLVALAEDLEEQLGPGPGQWDETQFVDDRQVQPRQWALQVQPPSLVPGLHQFVHQAGGGREARDMPRWQADRPSPRAAWVLPVPLLPAAMTFSRRWMYSHRANSITKAMFSDGMVGKSKLSSNCL